MLVPQLRQPARFNFTRNDGRGASTLRGRLLLHQDTSQMSEQDTQRASTPLVTVNFPETPRLNDLDQARAFGQLARVQLGLDETFHPDEAASVLLLDAARFGEIEIKEKESLKSAYFLHFNLEGGPYHLMLIGEECSGDQQSAVIVQLLAQAFYGPKRLHRPGAGAGQEAFFAEDRKIVAWANAFTAGFLGEPPQDPE